MIFTFDFTDVLNGGLSSLIYNGTRYDLTQPYTFGMNVNTAAGIYYVDGINSTVNTGITQPFTLDATASFTWNGQPIFNGLPLTGSGLAGADYQVEAGPFGADAVASETFILSALPIPEPPAVLMALAGLALVMAGRRYNRSHGARE
jgi:hypothetical protein